MKLSRNHRLIRWAYFPERFTATDREPSEIPANTTLCAIIWRSLVGVPLFCLLAIPMVCVLFIFVFPFAWLEEGFPETRFFKWAQERWTSGIIYTALKDWKNKTCTIVEIVDDPIRTEIAAAKEGSTGAPTGTQGDRAAITQP